VGEERVQEGKVVGRVFRFLNTFISYKFYLSIYPRSLREALVLLI
jgi:hypothetical protein